jgi:hypothetical protein
VRRAHLIVEGHGEVRAAKNLMARLCQDLDLPLVWAEPMRGKALHKQAEILRLCERLRATEGCEAALFLRDADDDCPKETGPGTARWLADARLPFPAAVVLAHREYEAWFLPCIHLMAGRPLRDERGIERAFLLPDASFAGDPEAIRGVKEWLSRHLPYGQIYKPTLDQLPLTRMLDFPTLRASGTPSFLTLERALRFLAGGGATSVYPPPR